MTQGVHKLHAVHLGTRLSLGWLKGCLLVSLCTHNYAQYMFVFLNLASNDLPLSLRRLHMTHSPPEKITIPQLCDPFNPLSYLFPIPAYPTRASASQLSQFWVWTLLHVHQEPSVSRLQCRDKKPKQTQIHCKCLAPGIWWWVRFLYSKCQLFPPVSISAMRDRALSPFLRVYSHHLCDMSVVLLASANWTHLHQSDFLFWDFRTGTYVL